VGVVPRSSWEPARGGSSLDVMGAGTWGQFPGRRGSGFEGGLPLFFLNHHFLRENSY